MTTLTPANQLTLLRMLLIPAFVILVVYGHLGWALVVFVTAGVTDALDGLIARRSGQKTSLGAWLDPMADKLLLVTTFVVLTIPGLNLAIGPRTFRPSIYGKIATGTYIVTAVAAMLFNYLGYHSVVVDVGVWTSLAITLVSAFHYIWHARRIIDAPAQGV
jgi:phosphatidylglycerophosphate synthase